MGYLIFQGVRIETIKVQVSSFTVLLKFTVKDYGIGPTSKVQVPDVEGFAFFPG